MNNSIYVFLSSVLQQSGLLSLRCLRGNFSTLNDFSHLVIFSFSASLADILRVARCAVWYCCVCACMYACIYALKSANLDELQKIVSEFMLPVVKVGHLVGKCDGLVRNSDQQLISPACSLRISHRHLWYGVAWFGAVW